MHCTHYLPGTISITKLPFTVKVISPSHEAIDAVMTGSSGSSCIAPVIWATFSPAEEGIHSLEISDDVGNVKSVSFGCCSESLAFDPQKCSGRISLSCSNHVATYTGNHSNTRVSVAGKRAYTAGRHVWCFKLHVVSSQVYLGVAALPGDGSYDGTRYCFDDQCNYSWNGNGKSFIRGRHARSNCSRFENGDSVSRVLDCQRRTLELHHQRTDERSVIAGIKCQEALYPTICMFIPGSQVEMS